MMYIILLYIFRKLHGLPGGIVVKSMPCIARDTVQSLGLGDLHAMGQQSPWAGQLLSKCLESTSHNHESTAATIEASACQEPAPCSKRSHYNDYSEEPAHHN